MAHQLREDPWCLTLSEDMMDARDFKVEEAIYLDPYVELPKSFSLWKRIRTTNYQNGRWSCTANSTSHGVQILNVKKKWIVPINDNIITPDRKDLRKNMGHDINDKDDSWDYVEKAVSTALKSWIRTLEGVVAQFDAYAYGQRAPDEKSIETMKRYLYSWKPIVWCLRWNRITRNELTKGQLKTFIPAGERTWGHAICLVWWDEGGFRFVNSRSTNDGKWYKSRFYVTYADMIKCASMFNRRYWIVYNKEDAKKDPEYLRQKANTGEAIKGLKKIYPDANPIVQNMIENLSKQLRKQFPELDDEIPIK